MSLHQAVPKHLDLAGVADLGLAHHDLKGAVGHVLPILHDAHYVLANLLRSEGDACGSGGQKGRQERERERERERLRQIIERLGTHLNCYFSNVFQDLTNLLISP